MAKITATPKAADRTTTVAVNRQSLDIRKWREAIKMAERKEKPLRYKLYDIYDDVMLDAHVSTVIDKRKAAILNAKIEFRRNNMPVDSVNQQLESPWFLQFIEDLLDTRFWGFSLFQFYRNGDWIGYDLIPRKHVEPVAKLILPKQDSQSGEDYTSFANMLECGRPNDLGLLCKLSSYVIYMRNCMADYAQYIELFGQPIREGTYDGYDEEARQKLLNDLIEMGGSAVLVHPDNTTVKLHETNTSGNSAELYKTLIDICKGHITTLVLGNTLSTEAGESGSRALGEVQKESEEDKKEADRIFVLNTLNYELKDIFTNLGFDCRGGEFVFVQTQNIDLSKRILIDQSLRYMGLPMADDYFYDTYGVPKPDDYESLKNGSHYPQPGTPPRGTSAPVASMIPSFAPGKKHHINVPKNSNWKKVAGFFD